MLLIKKTTTAKTATGGVIKKAIRKNLQYSQENTCVELINKVAACKT